MLKIFFQIAHNANLLLGPESRKHLRKPLTYQRVKYGMSVSNLYAMIRHLIQRGSQGSRRELGQHKLKNRLLDVLARTYDLGFTAFGGPPVHFQIWHRRFVDGMGKTPWIDEQTFQEMFALAQVLPGPGSTKMLVTIVSIHAGYIPALAVFLVWSLPSASGMYGLSLGVHRLKETLPAPVYAFLSGLNAATVGVIALAAVQLSRKAITDKLTRALVVFGGCAGLLFNALWYLPALLVGAGIVTIFWDIYMPKIWRRLKRRKVPPANLGREEGLEEAEMADITEMSRKDEDGLNIDSIQRRELSRKSAKSAPSLPPSLLAEKVENSEKQSPTQTSVDDSRYGISVKAGIIMFILFLMIFSALIGLRSGLSHPPLSLALFNNMFLAGTIIFGGGPVVIPLLREYVVQPGWVTPRDFILGLAIAQAFPGPNFCFAVYLGSLSLAINGYTPAKSFLGAMLGFLGIFTPGIWLCIAFQSPWRILRKKRIVNSLLRGVNAAAVGFVYTAVYRIWQVGYLTPTQSQGISLGNEPWWLLVTTTTFTLVEWYHFPPAVVIILGGLAGLGWWGAVKRN